MTDNSEIIVVGAGVLGCSIARELAPENEVLVLEKDDIAGGTTKNAKMGFISVVPGCTQTPDAAEYAMDFFHEYDDTNGFTFHEQPSVHLVTGEREEWARHHVQEIAENGFAAQYLSGQELEEEYPGVFSLSNIEGGAEYTDTGWVDSVEYSTALKEEAESNGAKFRTGVEVTDLMEEDGSVTGVCTADGEIQGSTVVLAAGWRTRELVSQFTKLPIRPFRWQGVELSFENELTDEFPIGWETDSWLFWRQNDDTLYVSGGTQYMEDLSSELHGCYDGFKEHVLDVIPDLLEGVTNPSIVDEFACVTGDAATPDNYPIVDAPDGCPDGVVVATGCPIGGIMTSPIVAKLVESIVEEKSPPFSTSQFKLDRFESLSPEFESSYVLQ